MVNPIKRNRSAARSRPSALVGQPCGCYIGVLEAASPIYIEGRQAVWIAVRVFLSLTTRSLDDLYGFLETGVLERRGRVHS